MSQSDIDKVAVSIPEIRLHATKYLTKDDWDTTDLLKIAKQAFRTDEQTFCGKIDYELQIVGKTD